MTSANGRSLLFLIFWLLLLTTGSYLMGADADTATPEHSTTTVVEKKDPFFPFEDEPEKVHDEDHFYKEFINMLGTLGVLVALIFAASWALKRLLKTRTQQLNTTSNIKILDQRPLSTKTALYLVEIHGRTMAIAESHNALIKLAEFPGFNTQDHD